MRSSAASRSCTLGFTAGTGGARNLAIRAQSDALAEISWSAPVGSGLASPTDVQGSIVGIDLESSRPSTALGTPGALIGYNVYRSSASGTPSSPSTALRDAGVRRPNGSSTAGDRGERVRRHGGLRHRGERAVERSLARRSRSERHESQGQGRQDLDHGKRVLERSKCLRRRTPVS